MSGIFFCLFHRDRRLRRVLILNPWVKRSKCHGKRARLDLQPRTPLLLQMRRHPAQRWGHKVFVKHKP